MCTHEKTSLRTQSISSHLWVWGLQMIFILSFKFSTMMLWQTLLVSHPESCPPFLLSNWTLYTQELYVSFCPPSRAKCSENVSFFPSITGVIMIGLIQSHDTIFFASNWLRHGHVMQFWPIKQYRKSAGRFLKKRTRRNSPWQDVFVMACNVSNCYRCLRIIWDMSEDKSQHLGMHSKKRKTN